MKEVQTYRDFVACFEGGCTRCSLSEHEGNYPVLYRGNPDADIMLVGEGPGLREREQNSCFVGPAGQLLDRIFASKGVEMVTNSHLLITNIVYCRPVAPANSGKQNYAPKTEQIARCWPFGRRAIELVDPAIIICCGLPAAETVLGLTKKIPMKDLEGQWLRQSNGRWIFIMMHPAAVLHQSSDPERQLQTKLKIWGYMQLFAAAKDAKIAEYRSVHGKKQAT